MRLRAKMRLPAALYDGFIMGIGFGAVLVLLGAIRELLGTGRYSLTCSCYLGRVRRPGAGRCLVWTTRSRRHFAAGCFLVTGCLIALKNQIDTSLEQRARAKTDAPVAGSKRVRVTGTVS